MVYNNDGCFVLRLSFGIMSNFHGDIRLKKNKRRETFIEKQAHEEDEEDEEDQVFALLAKHI